MAISSSESDWAWLPKELLDSILDKVASPFDRIRFSAVCKSWGTAVKERQARRRLKTQVIQTPMLLQIPNKDNTKRMRNLYSITNRKISDVNQLSMPYNRRCCGSSFGWLSFVTNSTCITLFNPFRKAKIRLPHILRGYRIYGNKYEHAVAKVTLSSDPASSPEDCLVVAMFGEYNELAFMKLGDQSWTYVEVLALDHRSGIVSVDVNINKKKKLALVDLEYAYETYLVETYSGDLSMLRRFFDSCLLGGQGMTGCFEVYKLVLDDESGGVVERACIGKSTFTIPVASSNFGGDPCPGIDKTLLVDAESA
ncbi:F-box protein At2g17036-like [Alnus glutinosa]|uniref:F-box protein At2g17036-like n=1 Tax=Alnus glutinosa TaxID=3517 RepID=UPI002D796BF4|nr:F-box protein At2g17036-like [Alnus glutinosa]